jgi:hypothetical protein
MSWEAIGAIGQAVSALALVLVIVQVRHARSEARRALSQGRAEAVRDFLTLATDERINRLLERANAALPHAPALVTRVFADQTGLTHEEAAVVFQFHLAWWNHTLQVIPYVDELPAIERVQFENGIFARLGSGVGRLFYEQMKGVSHPDAIQYIDSVLAHKRIPSPANR